MVSSFTGRTVSNWTSVLSTLPRRVIGQGYTQGRYDGVHESDIDRHRPSTRPSVGCMRVAAEAEVG
jgi:hypothetical protein